MDAGTCDVCRDPCAENDESNVTQLALQVIGAVFELNSRNLQQDVQNADQIIKVLILCTKPFGPIEGCAQN